MRTALLSAVLVSTVALVPFAAACTDSPPRKEVQASPPPATELRVGAVCSARFSFATDVSCGLADFGDVRFHCTDELGDKCPRTRSVTLENIGRTPVRLVAVSGSGPGERHETVSRPLPSGARQVVTPRAGDTYLYDILLRADDGMAAVGVVAVA
ncbi:hypothetical protein [Actinacidiphila glaucinigra]|uniref:Lipoprotein n=1 Tax=Actinacidiphila glaucinigra TaxID=235986 RepID=A0A239N871_9ACTN|nr:hypothetical protein [Actinacidiphila glaucinigra]SNT50940.1 hypothetical protein SAMN05216252_13266 [Actinacidiphila glaucinigra]